MKPAPPTTAPKTVAWLGYGGLIPFVALALATWVDRPRALIWMHALLAYGAVILSFVGALHWGFATVLRGLNASTRSTYFAWSIVPALLAWAALLVPHSLAVPLLVAGFAIHYEADRRVVGAIGGDRLPLWYLPLRRQLTTVACLSLVASRIAIGFNGFKW